MHVAEHEAPPSPVDLGFDVPPYALEYPYHHFDVPGHDTTKCADTDGNYEGIYGPGVIGGRDDYNSADEDGLDDDERGEPCLDSDDEDTLIDDDASGRDDFVEVDSETRYWVGPPKKEKSVDTKKDKSVDTKNKPVDTKKTKKESKGKEKSKHHSRGKDKLKS
jgi:hypothetical protein